MPRWYPLFYGGYMGKAKCLRPIGPHESIRNNMNQMFVIFRSSYFGKGSVGPFNNIVRVFRSDITALRFSGENFFRTLNASGAIRYSASVMDGNAVLTTVSIWSAKRTFPQESLTLWLSSLFTSWPGIFIILLGVIAKCSDSGCRHKGLIEHTIW